MIGRLLPTFGFFVFRRSTLLKVVMGTGPGPGLDELE